MFTIIANVIITYIDCRMWCDCYAINIVRVDIDDDQMAMMYGNQAVRETIETSYLIGSKCE